MIKFDSSRRGSDPEVLLRTWATVMRADGLSKRTIDERLITIAAAGRRLGVPLTSMTTADVREFVASFENASTRANRAAELRSWHAYLVAEGLREDDPACDVRPRSPRCLPRPARTTQIARLLDAADEVTRPIIVLAAFAGLRVHEIARVHGRDVDVEGATLRVAGKGGRTDMLPLHPMIAAEASGMPGTRFWFPSPVRARTSVSRYWVMDRFAEVALRAEVPVTAHQLRHWYATELVRAGVDLRTVQTLMRHAELTSTAIYTAVHDETRTAALRRLPSFGGTG